MQRITFLSLSIMLLIVSCATPPVWREINGVKRNLTEGNNNIADCALAVTKTDLYDTVTFTLEAESPRNNFRYDGDSRWNYLQVDETVYAKIADADIDARNIMLGRTVAFADVYIEKGRHNVEAVRAVSNVASTAEALFGAIPAVTVKLATPPAGTNDVNNEHRYFILYRVSDLSWVKSTNTAAGRTEIIRKMFDAGIPGEGFCAKVFDFARSLYASKKYDTIDAVASYLAANVRRDVNDVYQSERGNPFRKNNAHYINALASWRLAFYAKEPSLYQTAAADFMKASARVPEHERMANQKYALIASILAADALDFAKDTKGITLRFHLFSRSKISDLTEF